MKPSAEFHILALEGPDAYACAGGISSRVSGLAKASAEAGRETHLWFIGDAELPDCEHQGLLALHRWCQWISAHHRGGVYDGEEGKVRDYAASLLPFLFEHCLSPQLVSGGQAVVLAEEWHTVDAVLHLHWSMAELKARSVVFETYLGMPGMRDGVVTAGGAKAAWFKDSEGNTMALVQRIDH